MDSTTAFPAATDDRQVAAALRPPALGAWSTAGPFAAADYATALEAELPVSLETPYGICMYQSEDGQPYVILNDKDGAFVQYRVAPDYSVVPLRTWRTHGQPEGCVVDDRNAAMYLGEEMKGIWRMSADPRASVEMTLFDDVANGRLDPDVEGLALHKGERTRLVASSQGDDSFAVYFACARTYVIDKGGK